MLQAPQPEPFLPHEVTELAFKTMKAARFPLLATDDKGQPRLRPVSPVRTHGFHLWIANLRSYHKTREIAENPKVEVCYFDPEHHQLRITGTAEIETDASLLAEIWRKNPLLQAYLGSPNHPDLLIYHIIPHHVRYMKEWALEYHDVPLPP